jgi:hypothetical protein
MNDAKTSVSTQIFAGAIISAVQYLAPLRYIVPATEAGGRAQPLTSSTGVEANCW